MIKKELIKEGNQEYLLINGLKHPVRRLGNRIYRLTPLTPEEVEERERVIELVEKEFPKKK